MQTVTTEIYTHLGIDHERTRELLRQLNVLDLVVNRFSIEADTVGYRRVTDFDTSGCGKPSRRYSR